MNKNKGYTLVEMLIVITIMVIFSGLSFVVLAIIKDAKRTTAVNTFDSQISSCLVRTKAVSGKGVNSDPYCMLIQKRSDNKGQYGIIMGYYSAGKIVNDKGVELSVDNDNDCVAILPREVEGIKYDNKSIAEQSSMNSGDKYLIQFNKADGSVTYGAGTYELISTRNRVTGTYAKIFLDRTTGSHYTK